MMAYFGCYLINMIDTARQSSSPSIPTPDMVEYPMKCYETAVVYDVVHTINTTDKHTKQPLLDDGIFWMLSDKYD